MPGGIGTWPAVCAFVSPSARNRREPRAHMSADEIDPRCSALECGMRSALGLLALLLLAGTTHADDAPNRVLAERALSVAGAGEDDSGCPHAAWETRLPCLLAHRFAGDANALARARALHARHGVVVGVEEAHEMDGGFRGVLQLVPELPVGRQARHLDYVLRAHDAIETTLRGLREHARAPVTYFHRNVVYRFFRSVGRTTPSAYASGLRIGYNVAGSLHRNETAVRGTLVHEIFHLNDQAVGYWSERNLADVHARIIARCQGARACLAPYAPTATVVRGGTYYSFQPDNGSAVVEYAAEIGTRFLDEHAQILAGGRLRGVAFKCRAPENALVYARVSAQFFGGVDLTPPCR